MHNWLIIISGFVLFFGILLYLYIDLEILKSYYNIVTFSKKDYKKFVDSFLLYEKGITVDKNDYENNVSHIYETNYEKNTNITNETYNVLNDICTIIGLKKMYIPPEYDSNKSIQENQELHEKNIAKSLNVKPNSKILEVGCGCGRISNFISKETSSYVYGTNINKKHIEDAINFSKKEKNDKTFFKYGDLNKPIEFEDNFFDAIYVVQPLTYCNNLDNLFKEFRRVLKPNGKIVLCEYVLLDDFDKSNENHKKLLFTSKIIMEAFNSRFLKYFEKNAEKNNFKTLYSGYFKKDDNTYTGSEMNQLKGPMNKFLSIYKTIKKLDVFNILKTYYDFFDNWELWTNDLIEASEKNLLYMNWKFVFQNKK